MTLLDLASCSQRVARPSPFPRQQQVRVSLDHGPCGLFSNKRVGRTRSRRTGSKRRWKEAGQVEPKKVSHPREVDDRKFVGAAWGVSRGVLMAGDAVKMHPSTRQWSLTNAAAACLGMPCPWPRARIKPTTWD